jgi:hypothetical protein
MVLMSARMSSAAGGFPTMGFQVTGPSGIVTTSALQIGTNFDDGVQMQATQLDFLDASVGLNQGFNTFSAIYGASNGVSCTFSARRITVLPY